MLFGAIPYAGPFFAVILVCALITVWLSTPKQIEGVVAAPMLVAAETTEAPEASEVYPVMTVVPARLRRHASLRIRGVSRRRAASPQDRRRTPEPDDRSGGDQLHQDPKSRCILSQSLEEIRL